MPTFKLPQTAMTAREFEATGHEWKPYQHWTGAADPAEVAAIQELIEKYGHRIVAYHDYSPLPGAYSLELQFDDPRDEEVRRCRRDYHALFDADGNLIKAKRSRPKPR